MQVPESLDLELIKKRSIAGVVTFTARTLFIQIFTFFATFLLTILLDPSVFGIFFIASAFINLFVYFSDVGLAAALIQKSEEPTKNDLDTTFTIQQAMIISLAILGILFSSTFATFYHLDASGLLLLRVLLFSLILSSLKTIPSIILERRLSFTKLIIPQITENIVFYTIAVTLAWRNFGLASFTYAVFARGIVGLFLIYLLSPYKPSLSFNFKSVRILSSFGIPFQLNSILALLKDDLLIVFLGKILPFSQIGYIGWAQKWAYLPLRFFMDSVNKVTFPSYSRLQEHQQELSKAVEKSIFFVTYLVYPSVFTAMAIAPQVIATIPNYQKWQDAVVLLYLFSINSLFSAVSTTFTNALFALGHPKIVLKLMVFWTFATWLITYPLVLKFGYIGAGLASAIVATTSIVTVYFVKKYLKISALKSIFGPLASSLVMFLVIRSLSNILAPNILNIILEITLGAIIYLAISLAIYKRVLIEDSLTIIKALISKK